MNMKQEPIISLCLITKNEQHCLARCLDSVCHLVDEIIVVDTGSTDKTREIARQKGAQVFDFAWGNDFSAARNYALEQAHGTWILFLDADETLGFLSREDLFTFMKETPAEGYYVRILSYLSEGEELAEDFIVRLFKNRAAYRFAGVIHEQVIGSIREHNQGGGVASSPLTVHHFGYLTGEVLAKNKFTRNVDLIMDALAKHPHDAFLHYCLGIEYLQHGEIKLANENLYQALNLMNGGEGYLRHALLSLLLGLARESCGLDVEAVFATALGLFPHDGDLHCLYGLWLLHRQRFDEATAALQAALAQDTEIAGKSQLSALLGDALYLAEQYPPAQEKYLSAWRLDRENIYALGRLLTIWQENRAQVQWDVLSETLAVEKNDRLPQWLWQGGHAPLALFIVLLTIRKAAGDWEGMSRVCDTFRLMALQLPKCTFLPEIVKKYLAASAEELGLRAVLGSSPFACQFFAEVPSLSWQVEQNLTLILKSLLLPVQPLQLTETPQFRPIRTTVGYTAIPYHSVLG